MSCGTIANGLMYVCVAERQDSEIMGKRKFVATLAKISLYLVKINQ